MTDPLPPEPGPSPPAGPELEPEPVEGLRLYPSTIGGLLYLLVLAATVAGVGISWGGDWRFGVKWIGAALAAAGVLRLLLRQQDAGMLAVRHRLVDAVLLVGVGIAVVFLSESIPNQPL